MPGQPGHDLRVFVGGVVVENGVDQPASGHHRLDRVEEANELLMAVPLHAAADHRAIENVERGEQGRRAVANKSWVIVPALPGFSGRPGWVRSSAWICWGGWPPHGITVPK